MSDVRLLVAVAWAVLASATAIPAQQAATPRSTAQQDEALVARRDSLKARADSLRALVQHLEASARDSVLVAEVRAGGLLLRTTDTLRAAAAAALPAALNDARRLLGADADSLASHLQFTLREHRATKRSTYSRFISGPSATPTDDRITTVSIEGKLDSRTIPGVTLDYPVDHDELALGLLAVIERAAATRLPSAVDGWLDHRMPLRAESADFWQELYRQLATAEGAVTRRCVAGDRRACRLAFALDSMPADPVAAWYDAADYPAVARRVGDSMQRSVMYRSVSADERDDCTVRNQLDSCRRMLSLLPVAAFRVPMPVAARASLTHLTLELGGSGAAARLRAPERGSVGGYLAAASGVGVDVLLDRWMERVIAARPSSPLPNARFVLASLACIGVCVGWAARGQPWR